MSIISNNTSNIWKDIKEEINSNAYAKNGDVMLGNLDMRGNLISGLASPIEDSDGVSKGYLDEQLELHRRNTILSTKFTSITPEVRLTTANGLNYVVAAEIKDVDFDKFNYVILTYDTYYHYLYNLKNNFGEYSCFTDGRYKDGDDWGLEGESEDLPIFKNSSYEYNTFYFKKIEDAFCICCKMSYLDNLSRVNADYISSNVEAIFV